LYCFESSESSNTCDTIDTPGCPVAPKTTRSLDMVRRLVLESEANRLVNDIVDREKAPVYGCKDATTRD
jgi:hypothetical protein